MHSAPLKTGTGIKDSEVGIPFTVSKPFTLNLGNNYLQLWPANLLL